MHGFAFFTPFILATQLVAQLSPSLKAPQPSPAASVSRDLGISTFRIDYHSPAVKGRTIWGGLVPFDQVWRAGANDATTLTLSDPVRISGKEIPAGTYAFFAIPGKEQWTLVLNRQGRQWGAYSYKAEEDVVRVVAKPTAIPHQEYLEYALEVRTPDRLRVELRWEKLSVGFDLDVDTKALYLKYLDENLPKASAAQWQPWYQAARFCLEQGIEPEKAMAWIEISLKASEHPQNLECKARLLHKAGKRVEAIELMKRAVALGKEQASKEYVAGLETTLGTWIANPR